MSKILIIEDEEPIRRVLVRILKEEDDNFVIHEASDGKLGLDLLKNESFDLVLCDIKMPKVDGIELLQRTRKNNSTIPFIMLTGHGNIETAVESMKLGAYDFISKPPDLNRLINSVRLFAEFENYKRRTAKERIDLFKTAGKEVLSSLIPVVEDFKRALNQEDANQEDTQGIQLIYNKLTETLKNQGLEELEVKIGDSFDLEIHEAISQIPAQNDDQKGKIIDIIEGGYKLGDQVIKFPKVVVAQ